MDFQPILHRVVRPRASPSLLMAASAFGAGIFGCFGRGSVIGGLSFRAQESENAAPGVRTLAKNMALASDALATTEWHRLGDSPSRNFAPIGFRKWQRSAL
jgi:hypothetical protein